MSKVTLNNITGGYAAVDLLNENFDAIEAAFDNTLSRNGSTPNTWLANQDANHKRLLNVADPIDDKDAANKEYVINAVVDATPIAFNKAAYTVDQFTGDGVDTTFSLTQAPGMGTNTQTYINGAYQNKNTYAVNGTTLTFTEAPPLNSKIEVFVITPLAAEVNAASNITIADAGNYYSSGYVEGALQEVMTRVREQVSVKDFGAVGDGVTDDTTAFTDAVASGNPVYVPYTTDFYAVTALTADQIKALYGPGTVKIAGALQQISSNASALSNDIAGLRYVNQNLQPSKWPSVDGSLFNGATSVQAKRTGGYGSYGLSLIEYLVDTPLAPPQFDVGQTAWVSTTNLVGGQAFGAWFGANTPSSSLGETYSSGSVIGMEINVGNRWGEIGLQSDITAVRCVTGLQIVPDVLPAPDGAYSGIYNGTFGQVFAQSIHGHKWWTATLIRADAIAATGIAHQANGGSTALLAPASWTKVTNYWEYALDLGSGTFLTAPINIPNSATSTTATAGGVGTLPPGIQGYLKIAVGGVVCKVPYYNN